MNRREFIRVKSAKAATEKLWIFFISTKRFVRYSAAAARSLTKMFPECFDFVVKKPSFLSLFGIKKPYTLCVRFFGGDDETRTHYLYNANVALSQMSYAPKRL